jgi:hypothetical protein
MAPAAFSTSLSVAPEEGGAAPTNYVDVKPVPWGREDCIDGSWGDSSGAGRLVPRPAPANPPKPRWAACR